MPSVPTTADAATLTQLVALCIAIIIVKVIHTVWNRLEDRLEPVEDRGQVAHPVLPLATSHTAQ